MYFKFELVYILTITSISVAQLEYDIITDFTVNDCLRENNPLKRNYFALDSNGFPHCHQYNVPTSCSSNVDKSCGPGLTCDIVHAKCIVDKTSCFKYYANIPDNSNIMQLLWTPDCLEDGSWATKQCKGGAAGRCFCYDTKGQRLFGNAFADSSSNMTCACSKRKFELTRADNPNRRAYVSFHCDSQGNYEELQCDTDHCWCVEPKTGKLTSIIVPEKAMKYLKCSKKLKGSQYLRKCESQAYAESKIEIEMKKHGTLSPNIQVIACGNDGSYGPYSIKNAQAYCVKSNNGGTNYQASIAELKLVNCNCALDQDLYERLGKPFTLMCNSTGNYEPLQSILEDDTVKNFCVDTDGNKNVDNVAVAENSFCQNFLPYT